MSRDGHGAESPSAEVQQLMEVIGCEDVERCQQLMDLAHGDIPRAVELHFDNPDLSSLIAAAATAEAAEAAAVPPYATQNSHRDLPEFLANAFDQQQERPATSFHDLLQFEQLPRAPYISGTNTVIRVKKAPKPRQNSAGLPPAASNSLWETIRYILSYPLNIVYKMGSGIMWILLYILFPTAKASSSSSKEVVRERDLGDTKLNAELFAAAFEDSLWDEPENSDVEGEKAGSELLEGREKQERVKKSKIEWYIGGYNDALNEMKKTVRPMIVILQDDENPATKTFNRDVLNSNEVSTFLAEKDVLIWGGNVLQTEAYKLAGLLESTRQPFVALILPLPSSTTPAPTATIMKRFQGNKITKSYFIRTIRLLLDQYEPQLVSLRFDMQELEMSRKLRESQDAAYEASLRADQEREAQREAEAQRAKKEAEEAQQAEYNRIKGDLIRRRWLESKLDWFEQLEQENNDETKWAKGEFARIALKFSDGEKMIRKLPASFSVYQLYLFIECYRLKAGMLDGASEAEETTAAAALGVEVTDEEVEAFKLTDFSFELCSPYPRKLLHHSAAETLRECKEIYPSGSLLVEELGEVEDDDSEEEAAA